MDETCELLRQVFRTKNPLTFPVSGTGMAGMECVATNLIEPGDEVIVCINGVFGARMKDVMERCGATVHAVEAPWGDIFTLEADRRRARAAPARQAPRHRPRRDQHRRASAARRPGRARPRPRRVARGGHGHQPRRPRTARGRLGHRRQLQRHAEMPELPARPVAGELRRARAGPHGRAQDQAAVVVSRRLDAAQVLRRRQRRPLLTTTPRRST